VRGLTISAHGGLDQLQYRTDLPTPALTAPTDVRIRVHAAALNHLDLFVVGGLPNVQIVPPWIVGCDAAGVIAEVGTAVDSVAVGDHVIVNAGISDRTCEYCRAGEQSECVQFGVLGEHLPGTFAEEIVVPAFNVRPIPRHIPMEVAAAFPLATLTAWRLMVTKAQVHGGDTVLIWGIGGGVALAALMIAKARGARVWVTSGSDAKLDRAIALGADHGFNHRLVDVAREVRARTNKRGVDVVVDSVGTATWGKSLLSLGRGGRLVTCGGTSGPMLEMDIRRLFWYQWTIYGSTMGNDREFDCVANELAHGRLLPPVDMVYPLEQGRQAYERMAAGEQFGKIVLRIAEPGA
jgi:NADPH:quinone reductase-like Zn-dependent oxidoreductase